MTYEYQRLQILPSPDGFIEAHVTAWLNEQGADGWELVCINDVAGVVYPVATFKRQVTVGIATSY
jgi:hypothetical protein